MAGQKRFELFLNGPKPLVLPLHYCPMAPGVGLEPTTTRLTAEISTIEISRNYIKPVRGIEPLSPEYKTGILTFIIN